ncbi:MAG: hypothetical protein IKN15_11130 [Bacteroidaceae bacterium]|nr:hypothetical protein [Bacteroidaceae bacterium]
MKTIQSVITTLMLLCMSLGMQAQAVYITVPDGRSIGSSRTREQRPVGDTWGLSVSGKIYGSDELEEKPYPLPNAHIQLVCLNDTTAKTVETSWGDGMFYGWLNVVKKRIKKNEAPRVQMKVTFVGYEPYEKVLTLEKQYEDEERKKGNYQWGLHLDSVVLKSTPMSTQEVLIVGELKRMYESGDTTIFNVDAFEMPRGTVLLNLVRRMPGLRYEEGQLTYRDSVIHEIRLNGESFFAHDMRIALENIENQDLKQFRIYKTQADTLSTDTTKHLVADMITKNPVDNVVMTKPEVGTTNIKNTYHFMMTGLQWKSGNRGEWNADVRLDDLPSASTKKNSNNSVNGSLRRQFGNTSIAYRPNYNYIDNRYSSELLSSTIMPEYEQYSISTSESKNYNNNTGHNLSANGMLTERGFWNINTNYSYNDSQDYDRSSNASYSGNPYGGENNELLDETQLKAIGLNRQTSESQSRSHQQQYSINGHFNSSFEGNKVFKYPSISFNVAYSGNEQYGSSTEWQQTDYLQYGDSVWTYRRRNITPSNSGRFTASTDYGFQFGPEKLRQRINLTYEFEHDCNERDNVYYDLMNDGRQLDSLSSHERTMNVEHRIQANYNINIKGVNLSVNVAYMPTRNRYEYVRLDGVKADTTQHTADISGTVQMSYHFTPSRSMSLYYYVSSQMVSGSNLVQPTTIDNPLFIRVTNPNLKKPVRHSFNMHANLGAWAFGANYGFSRNNVSSRSIYNKKTGGTISSLENINGNWGTRLNARYGTDFKHANIAINVAHNYNHSVNYIQTSDAEGKKGMSNVQNIEVNPQFTLYTQHFDLSLSGRYNYQWGNSDYATSMDKMHNYQINSSFNYWIGERLTFNTDLNVSGRAGGKMRDVNRTDFIWNMGVEYKLLKDYRGLLKLTWYDILKERSNFSTNISATGRSELRTSGNPHYVLLTFQYKLYKMK